METEEQVTAAVDPKGPPEECNVCHKVLANHGSLVTHRRNVHGIRSRPARTGGGDAKARRIAYQKAYRDKKRAELAGETEPVIREKKDKAPVVHVHFCPNCGTNIDAVHMAIKMTS